MLEDAEDLAIVEGVIGLTQAFHRQTIAEGVETVEHGLLLMHLGCDIAQGYGLARPMPASAVPHWISAFRLDPLLAEAAVYSWGRDDLPLLLATADHKRWLAQLGKHLDNPGSAAPQLDGQDCRFGHWYASQGRTAYGKLASFAAIGNLHQEVHILGQAVGDLLAQRNSAVARERYAALSAASGRLLQALTGLQNDVQRHRLNH